MPTNETQILFADDYVQVTLDPKRGLVTYKRTSRPYQSIDEMRAVHRNMAAPLVKLSPKGLVLLFDVRDAPPRNDANFEAEVTKAISEFLPGFRAHAFLVRSAVGRLQVRRLATSRGDSPSSVFSSEPEALAHLGLRDET
jgi:hypothetical protein